MNKVILNGIDVSEALDKLEKVKNFIEVVKQAEQAHRADGYICFGKADCCEAIINDFEIKIGDNE